LCTSQVGDSGRHGQERIDKAGKQAQARQTQRQGRKAPKMYTTVMPVLTNKGPLPARIALKVKKTLINYFQLQLNSLIETRSFD